jgi:hypothetical protein
MSDTTTPPPACRFCGEYPAGITHPCRAFEQSTTVPLPAPVVAPVTEERLGPLSDNNLCAQALLADADEVPDGTFLRYSFTVDQLRKFTRALLAQQPSGDEALMRLAMEELVDCPSRVGGYGKRSKVIAALRARLEGTKP